MPKENDLSGSPSNDYIPLGKTQCLRYYVEGPHERRRSNRRFCTVVRDPPLFPWIPVWYNGDVHFFFFLSYKLSRPRDAESRISRIEFHSPLGFVAFVI